MGIAERECTQRTRYILAFFTVVASSSNLSTLNFGAKVLHFEQIAKSQRLKGRNEMKYLDLPNTQAGFYEDFTEMQSPMPGIAASGISLSTIAFGVGLFHNCVNQHHTVIFVHIVGLCICA